jgi:hypothetical protein
VYSSKFLRQSSEPDAAEGSYHTPASPFLNRDAGVKA